MWFEYQLQVTLESGSRQYEMFEILTKTGYDIFEFKASALESIRITAPEWGRCNICDYEARLQITECVSPLFVSLNV